MLLDGIFIAAALWAAIHCNMTAMGLLLSNLVALMLEAIGVPFNLFAWMLLDAFAIILAMSVGWKNLTDASKAVILLFPVLWVTYIDGNEQFSYVMSKVIVTVQLLLVWPRKGGLVDTIFEGQPIKEYSAAQCHGG